MVGIARHMASYGVRVATPEFCHSSFVDTDHQQNGIDLAELATRLAGGADVLFAGHSAGGLAAALAAKEAGGSAPVLGLDLVDAEDLALTASSALRGRVFLIAGEAGSCNASGNGVALATGSTRAALRVVGANHCDFEDSTGLACTFACGAQTGALTAIKALSAAFVAWQLGLDATGEAWTTPAGSDWQRLVSEGLAVGL